MNDAFTMKLRAAVIAGWWTLLIWWGVLAVAWLVWLCFLRARPDWMLAACGGGDLTWTALQRMVLRAIGFYKMVMYVFLMVLVWMSLWVRRLRKAAG